MSSLVRGILMHDLLCCRKLFFHQVPILQKGLKEQYLPFPGLFFSGTLAPYQEETWPM